MFDDYPRNGTKYFIGEYAGALNVYALPRFLVTRD